MMKNSNKDFHDDDDDDNEAELELGLGLSLGGGGGGCGGGGMVKFLTAHDLQTSGQRPAMSAGSKRTAHHHDLSGSSTPSISQVVGWPPIRTFRMNSLQGSQSKGTNSEEGKTISEHKNKKTNTRTDHNQAGPSMVQENTHLGFVKVNMDGMKIGRKVDLSAHSCYETLSKMIEDMFFKPPTSFTLARGEKVLGKPSKFLDGLSEFVLTYEDKEGDWMLVGDVPWGMFLSAVKRLRIMRTNEAYGLATRSQERDDTRRSNPIRG